MRWPRRSAARPHVSSAADGRAGCVQGPRIGWKLGWGVENSASKCAVRVENQHQKYEYNVETLARKLCSQNRLP